MSEFLSRVWHQFSCNWLVAHPSYLFGICTLRHAGPDVFLEVFINLPSGFRSSLHLPSYLDSPPPTMFIFLKSCLFPLRMSLHHAHDDVFNACFPCSTLKPSAGRNQSQLCSPQSSQCLADGPALNKCLRNSGQMRKWLSEWIDGWSKGIVCNTEGEISVTRSVSSFLQPPLMDVWGDGGIHLFLHLFVP